MAKLNIVLYEPEILQIQGISEEPAWLQGPGSTLSSLWDSGLMKRLLREREWTTGKIWM